MNTDKPVYPYRIRQLLLTFLIAVSLGSLLLFTNWYHTLSEDLFNSIMFGVIASVILLIFWIINRRNGVANPFRFKLINGKLMGLSLVFIMLLHLMIVPFLNELIVPFTQRFLTFESGKPGQVNIAMWLGALVLGPIAEELIFRQYFLKGLLGRHRPWAAILISGVAFGLVHVLPTQVWPAVILGILFGVVFYQTKSIGNTILLHCFTNMLVLLFSIMRTNREVIDSLYTTHAILIFTIGLLGIVLVSKLIYNQIRGTYQKMNELS